MKRIIWLLLFIVTPIFADITAEISKQKISINDAVRLTLTIEGTAAQGMPDLIPLQRDFEINATEHRVSTVVVNGQMQTLNQWSITLRPKKMGILSIPAITIGQEKSNSLRLEVSSNGESSTATQKTHMHDAIQTPQRILLKTELSETSAYVNQQMIYTVKLMHQDQLLDANYQPPTLENALIVPLGDSEQYQTTDNETHYWVEEQRYAVFPQKSGEQTLTSPIFQALVFRGMPQRVQVQDDPRTINIKPVPATFAKNWLPAKSLQLKEKYDSKENQLDLGATLVRTITIEGQAIPAELLPTFNAKPEKNYGVYPEKPMLKNIVHDPDLIGIKTIKITYLLNQAGEITLPSYTIKWFNTTTGKEETSMLPARVIQVTPSGLTTTTAPLKQLHATPAKSQSTITTTPITSESKLPWLIAASMGILWIMTILGFLIYKKRRPITTSKHQSLKILEQACKENDPAKARAALLQWATQTWPKKVFLNLDDVKQQVSTINFEQALAELSEALYQKEKYNTWQGESLWSCVKAYQKQKYTKRQSPLPPLNP